MLNLLQAVYQPEGGILASELCIAAHIKAAQAHGADFHAPEKVEAWKVDEATGNVTVFTDRGQYSARKLVLTAGSWMPDIMPELQVILFTQCDCRCTMCLCCLMPFPAVQRHTPSQVFCQMEFYEAYVLMEAAKAAICSRAAPLLQNSASDMHPDLSFLIALDCCWHASAARMCMRATLPPRLRQR